MALPFKKKSEYFEVPVQDMVLRVKGPHKLYEEARAAGMAFWEQLQSYCVRHRQFGTSKSPVSVPETAPELVRRMAAASRIAGVGPVFTIQGAVTEAVGRALSRTLPDVVVSSDGNYFITARRRSRLVVHPGLDGQDDIAVVVKPELGPHGVFTTTGSVHLPARIDHGVVVVATSSPLAAAAGAGAMAILSRPRSFARALRYLQGLNGVHGGILVGNHRIGVAGSLELAA